MGFFSKIINGLRKTKNNIADKLGKLFGMGITDEFYEQLEEILISADIGAGCSMRIVDELRERVSDKRIKKEEEVRAELRDIMVDLLDFEPFEPQYPVVLLIVGVNGVGKTTSIGKLAHYYVSQKKSVLLAAGDTFRAAAADQLAVWAERSNVRLVRHAEGADPSAVVFDAIASAKAKNTDVLIVDTAGRLHNKTNLMQELNKINRVIDREYPNAERYSFLVLDATTGQNAIAQVQAFDEAVELDGLILTKLDGTAKGGVVLAINEETDVPVRFVGVGEGVDDLLPFDAESFVDGIL